MEEQALKATKNAGKADINDIKNDLSSLRDNVVGLAQDIRNGGGSVVREGIGQVRTVSGDKFHKVEERIRDKPGQSVAMAFLGGLIFSYMMRR